MKRTKSTNGNRRIETPARILGIDFTSAPRRRKPITLARGALAEGQLRIDSVVCLTSLERVEEEIASPGPWVAGIDFPFGQPRRLIRALGWPQRWNAYVSHVESMGKNEFESVLEEYSNGQPKGAKQHKRAMDKHARSISPMRLNDAVHTMDLPAGNRTEDVQINATETGTGLRADHGRDCSQGGRRSTFWESAPQNATE